MIIPNSPVYKNKMRGMVYVLNFIFSLQLATTTYFAANYLVYVGITGKFLPLVFALVSVVAILAFAVSPIAFNRFGVYKTVIASSVAYIVIFIAQAFAHSPKLAMFVFLLGAVPSAFIIAALDTLMERFTVNNSTGGQRGVFLTMANTAFVAGPVLGGLLAKGGGFDGLWIAAAAMMFPFTIIALFAFRKVERIKYNVFSISRTARHLLRDKNVLGIFLAQFVLYFYFSIMVIFTSVYLNSAFGMDTDKVGYIMAIALTAYVFLTIPLGYLADKKYGEKEMLIIGFIIISLSTFAFALNSSPSFIVIALIIFATRVGASFVQTMTESYFFKHIDGGDADLIVAFRALYPIGSIVAPLVAAPVLFVYGYKEVFLLTSVLMLAGVYFSLRIKDTK